MYPRVSGELRGFGASGYFDNHLNDPNRQKPKTPAPVLVYLSVTNAVCVCARVCVCAYVRVCL